MKRLFSYFFGLTFALFLLQLGNHYLLEPRPNFYYSSSVGNFVDENSQESTFWEDLANGNYTESENEQINNLASILASIGTLVVFITSLPDYVVTLVSVLPPLFSSFLIAGLGLLISVVIVKIAIHIF